ncbi:MAG: methylated-DNA--[protein]-cysteine S-methyltransferase [Caulobacterales bacterium]
MSCFLTDDERWAAMQARDTAADGAFVFAVRTTGVYCRPSCPGRPLRRNVTFHDSPASARAAGFRACLRCKPDTAGAVTYAFADTVLGLALVAMGERGLKALLFGPSRAALAEDLAWRLPHAMRALDEAGLRPVIDKVRALVAGSAAADIPLDPAGGAFERAVWAALREIPAGRTASYGEIAGRIGRPGEAKAVAEACAANPIAVLTPCHRVVRADGSISGYRWGVWRKRALLRREQAA